MKIYDFFKAVVNTCTSSDSCSFCPIQTIAKAHKKPYYSCRNIMFDYFIETDKIVGQKIHDEFVKLNIDIIPNLHYTSEEKIYEEQIKIFEKYYKSNSLEIE